MLDQLRKDVIGETLDTQVARFFDTDAAADRCSKKLLVLCPFEAPVVIFVRH